jgi:hypothetical protein
MKTPEGDDQMTMSMTNLPSDEQLDKLYRLAGERVVRKLGDDRSTRVDKITARVQQAEESGELTRSQISLWITWLEQQPVDRYKNKIPAGKYALKSSDGTINFYQVDRPAQGHWAGHTFTKLLTGAPGNWHEQRLNRVHREHIENWISSNIEYAARLFGQTVKHCGHCGSALSIPQSRAAGYGEKCAADHGYWYPTLTEALETLGELK